MIVFPEEDRYQEAAENFCNSLVSETKEIIEDEKIPDPQPVTQLIEVRTDQKATSLIARAIAKIAFIAFCTTILNLAVTNLYSMISESLFILDLLTDSLVSGKIPEPKTSFMTPMNTFIVSAFFSETTILVVELISLQGFRAHRFLIR